MNLEIIKLVQKIDNPYFVSFVKFLNYFDRGELFLILIIFLWVFFGSKTGLRLFYLLMINNFTNKALKSFFKMPRPFQDDPSVGILTVDGCGFPSGAAQTSILLGGILICSWKNPWRWPIAIFYVLLISFSRVYLGVHYPIDILGGWIFGVIILAIYLFVFPPIEKVLAKENPIVILFAGLSLLGLFIACFTEKTVLQISSLAIGLTLGFFLAKRKKISYPKRKWVEKIFIDLPIAIAGIIVIYFLIPLILYNDIKLTTLIHYSLIGFWLSFLAILVCRKIPNFIKKS